MSSDFSRNLSEVDIGELSDNAGLPEKVEWCGDNAVVLGWGGKVIVVGPAGDSLKYVNVFYGVSGTGAHEKVKVQLLAIGSPGWGARWT